jgi:GTP-binding protein HflX
MIPFHEKDSTERDGRGGDSTIAKVFGDLKGLTHTEHRDLERLYRRKIPSESLLTPELARVLAQISGQTERQVGLIIDRRGSVRHVILGDHHSILIPDISFYRRGPGRLRGLRCIHTHLGEGEGLNMEDLTDLALLRLDAMVAIEVRERLPEAVHFAHLLPPNPEDRQWEVESYRHASSIDISFLQFIQELEVEIQRAQGSRNLDVSKERAILVHASALLRAEAESSLSELEQLTQSSDTEMLEKIWQRTPRYNPAHLLGRGKLREILMKGLYLGATLVVFDQDLSPVQVNNIAKMVDLKVIDRTQLILDIFARRARSKEGKIQVELAQLRYLLPRLIGRGTAMSRLMGGIGGRGPGETKLEVDRRRVKQRIGSLERELKGLARGREERRKRRTRHRIPLVSIIGYTNAGKSTLLNRLTGSNVFAENRLFATLDPTTRQLALPDGRTILLADTVGFIRHMPKELKVAFRATLEELQDAGLFLHVVDLTSQYKQEEIEAVERILEEMGLSETPRILVFNKADLAGEDRVRSNARRFAVSATTGVGLSELVEALAARLRASPHPHNETPSPESVSVHKRFADPQGPVRT